MPEMWRRCGYRRQLLLWRHQRDGLFEDGRPPVDLNRPHLLAQDGLAPSEGNPHFHQQMVYAVAMTTLRNFERALGRTALWSPRKWESGMAEKDRYVQRLRIYPHALREANADYSPEKKALLFGYFPAATLDPRYHRCSGSSAR